MSLWVKRRFRLSYSFYNLSEVISVSNRYITSLINGIIRLFSNISGEVVVFLWPKGFWNLRNWVGSQMWYLWRSKNLYSESFIRICALYENRLNASIVFTIYSGHACFTLVVEELLTLDLVAVHPNILRIPDVLVLPIITVGSRCCLRITETPDIFGYRYQCWRDSCNVSLCLAKYVELGELRWKWFLCLKERWCIWYVLSSVFQLIEFIPVDQLTRILQHIWVC